MDWHFKQNKLASSRTRHVKSRAWFLPAAAWHENSETVVLTESTPFESSDASATAANADDDIEQKQRMLADPSQKDCAICNEPFETQFDDDENDWIITGVSRLSNGKLAHIVCQKK